MGVVGGGVGVSEDISPWSAIVSPGFWVVKGSVFLRVSIVEVCGVSFCVFGGSVANVVWCDVCKRVVVSGEERNGVASTHYTALESLFPFSSD